MPDPTSLATQPFEDHLRGAFHQLRSAFTSALVSVGADPHRPRPLARELGVSKSLAWRISRIVVAQDPAEAVPHVPGPDALAAFLSALRKAGAPLHATTAVRDAMQAYDSMVAEHTGDRQTLDQLTATMGDPRAAERLEQGRRQAFLGMGGTWGVQALVQFSTTILHPSAEAGDRVDVASLKGLVDLKRLRSNARWTLFRRTERLDDGSMLPAHASVPLDPAHTAGDVPLLGEFSSASLPKLLERTSGNVTRSILPPGPVGNTSALTCVFGELHPAAMPLPGPADEPTIRIGTSLVTPVERLQLDLVVHEALAWAADPGVALFSQLDGGGRSLADDEDFTLPLFESVHELGRGVATMASPDVPRYGDMLAHAFRRAGWDDRAFLGYRFVMRYPPIPTVAAFLCEHRAGRGEAPVGS